MLDAVRPDFVINLVAATNVDRCEERPDEAYRLNVRSVETLSGWLKRGQTCHLIHVSTDQVYEGEGPHREDDVNIVNVYALSKYAGELAALAAGATVLRSNFFGPSMLAGRSSFSDWIIARLRAGEAFTAFDDVAFTPLSMATLGAAIARVIEMPAPGVFNLGSRHGMSKAEFAFALARHFGLDASPIRPGSHSAVKLRARRPLDMRMDSTLFEQTFGFILPGTEREISGLDVANASG